MLTLGALRSDRSLYPPAALAAALAATWSWLGAAHVTLVEAYTLPAAAAALALGIVTRTTRPASSWTTVAASIVLGLGPTAALGIANDDTTRIVIAAIAAFLVLLAGARGRLQAPLVLGAATLVALALDLVAPEAARLPRWTVLAGAGALLLWAGATFERRREDLRRATRTLLGFR
jgi:cell division protein FtsW (lipid II flippase)